MCCPRRGVRRETAEAAGGGLRRGAQAGQEPYVPVCSMQGRKGGGVVPPRALSVLTALFFVTALLHVAPCHAVAAEREAVAAVSRAVVDAPKASLSALCRSKAVTIEEQKVLAAVRAS